MAVELIAVPLKVLLEKASAVAADRVGLMWRFSENLEAMEKHVTSIQAVLADARSKQSAGNVSVKAWLKTVEGVVFEAEIVLDELLYENLRRQVCKTNSAGGLKVCSFFSLKIGSRVRDLYFCTKMGSRVGAINEKLEKLETLVLGIGLTIDLLHHHVTNVTVDAADRQTNSLPQHYVAGRDQEESKIVDMLLLGSSNDDNPRVSVLPIVGMGGLGKTTLAKSVYNNRKIVDHFIKRCWICVSDKSEVTSILKDILEVLNGGKKFESSIQEAIVQGIEKELSGERFLFVLDDVWNCEWWEKFLNFLNYVAGFNSTGGNCCVLITTRLQRVANGVCTLSNPFVLDKLSNDDCWSILVKRALKGGEMQKELNDHREQLLRRCQGLPLAANVIGGLLSLQSRERWGSVVDRILKIGDEVDGEIGPILKLSYDYLPSRFVKKCFVYCSIYQKDAMLDGEKLIGFWMAEGFLQEDVGGRTMEEVGADYLSILVQSSLLERLLILPGNPFRDPLWIFQMHDLVHDLACSISKQEQHDGERYRHVALGKKIVEDCWNEYSWNENSMLIQVVQSGVSGKMLLKYRHARVMNLSSSRIWKLPNAIGKLKHKRCLTLSLFHIKSLPESLWKLYNLQTLRLSYCEELDCLPQGLSNLYSLRHLYYGRNEKLKRAPNMGQLTCLQTLAYFNVGEKNVHEIKELGFMKNLKGSLSIRNLELVDGKKEATSADFFNKKNLTSLELVWGSATTTTRRNSYNWEDVLEGLEPCSALQRLTISYFIGIGSPRWLGKLSSLVALKLEDCENMSELGYSGDTGFPNLKDLYIRGCPRLSSARTSFPILERLFLSNIQVSVVRDIISTTSSSLKYLTLRQVSRMRRLSDVIESSRLSSCLKILDIDYCDDLSEIPSSTLECCSCLESLAVVGCTELVSFPLNLQQTPCLSLIKLWDCPKLMTRDAVLPRGFEHLTNLKTLWIRPDNSEQSINWDALKTGCSTTLGTLTMKQSCRTQLPQQLQHFSSLLELQLFEFESLERLPGWLDKLTSLRKLLLCCFPKLEHVPTDAIRSLTNLRELDISDCPLIRETQSDEIEALPNLRVGWAVYSYQVRSRWFDW